MRTCHSRSHVLNILITHFYILMVLQGRLCRMFKSMSSSKVLFHLSIQAVILLLCTVNTDQHIATKLTYMQMKKSSLHVVTNQMTADISQ